MRMMSIKSAAMLSGLVVLGMGSMMQICINYGIAQFRSDL